MWNEWNPFAQPNVSLSLFQIQWPLHVPAVSDHDKLNFRGSVHNA